MHADIPTQPFRVLVVDDNEDVADSEAMLLRLSGHEVLTCYRGQDALDEALSFRPSVCLIDLNMPGMDGDEVAIRLNKLLDGHVRLVAITARNDEQSHRKTQAAGFHQHLVKPVDPLKLVAVVNAQRQLQVDARTQPWVA